MSDTRSVVSTILTFTPPPHRAETHHQANAATPLPVVLDTCHGIEMEIALEMLQISGREVKCL